MQANRLYYRLKPFLPWRFRMALRRIVARRKLKASQGTWPINETAGKPRIGWKGWPGVKRFTLVLTHDVEGPIGLAKCRQLMQLEMKYGLRSSFNFVPEGGYEVSLEMRKELRQGGFEVGVHDLHHDGKLYHSRRHFSKHAAQINKYIKEWEADGFRSGFMLRELDWLHDLNILYDASTFDTDPFEPQPGGVGTIFPFWVPVVKRGEPASGGELHPPSATVRSAASNSRSGTGRAVNVQSSNSNLGFVELPYTLPQDSTLFFVLKEGTPAIWKRKLDWIALRGGMALINVHPDYLGFDGRHLRKAEYPAAWYEEFLQYVQSRYNGEMWNALPSETAAWYKEKCVPEPSVAASTETIHITTQAKPARNGTHSLAGKNVAVVLFSHYLSDPRPRRAAEMLARHEANVEVICLQANPDEPKREVVNGVRIHRVPVRRQRGGRANYVYQYSAFTLVSLVLLTARSLRRRYDLVHVHNMPDFLVFSALVPKLLGAKVILDLHDPMPELMLTIFKLPPESFSVRLLKRIEKWSTRFADVVLTVNLASKRIYSSRSCPPEKIHVVMNSPNEDIFQFRPPPLATPDGTPDRRFAIMYHGSLLPRNGFDLAIQALERVKKSIPGATLVVCGERTPFFESVMTSAAQRGIQGAVNYLGMKRSDEITEVIDRCDLGIIPNHRNIFTEMNTPTRIFEYLSRGKPVISPRARGIQDYFGDRDLIYFELGNGDDLARKIEYVYTHPGETKETVERGQKVYLAHRWSQESAGLVDTVAGMLGRR